jgi:hypothetical protein
VLPPSPDNEKSETRNPRCVAPIASSRLSSACADDASSPPARSPSTFDVSERTIYRDIADLIASDVPSGSCLLFDISSFNVSAQIRLHTKKVEAMDAHRQKLTMARPYCE